MAGTTRAVADAEGGPEVTSVGGAPPALRDKGALTRLMILRILARGPVGTLRQVADEVGITVQAVSEHIKRLAGDGAVVTGDDGPRVTPEGLEALRGQLRTLKDYVDSAVRDLNQVESTAAKAGAKITAGQRVGLFMERGELVAYPERDSPSRGVAAQDAVRGRDVAIVDLEGIISLQTGRVTFGLVPDAAKGGSRAADKDAVREACKAAGLVVAVGPVAGHLATNAGVSSVRFAAAAVAVDGALRGLDVLVLVEESQLLDVERSLERARAEWDLDLTIETVRVF